MTRHLLIAEDHPSFAEALDRLLVSHGYRVTLATDGICALQSILKTPPDLLLLDLDLPGLSGVELLRKLRASARTAALPVIVMSGHFKGDRYVRAAQDLGVRDYLEKPFPAPRLLAALEQALPMSGASATDAETAGFDRHLLRAYTSRFSGILRLDNSGRRHELTFVNGTPVSLRPGFRHEDFGEFLFKTGVIDNSEQAAYRAAGINRHDLLVQMGCLRYQELLERKYAYLSQELISGFTRPAMKAERQPFSLPDGLQVLTVNIPEIVCKGYHAVLSAQQCQTWLQRHAGHYAATLPAYYASVNLLDLNEEECALLASLDGRRTLNESTGGSGTLVPLLFTLAALGMIRIDAAPLTPAPLPDWPLRTLFNRIEEIDATEELLEDFDDLAVADEVAEEAAAPSAATADAPATLSPQAVTLRDLFARVDGRDYYAIFGLTPGNFAFAALRDSYFALTRQLGPDLLMQLGGEDAAMAETILSRVADAYDTLSDVVKKEKYDQMLNADRIGLGQQGDDRFHAQVQAQSGKVFIDMEEWDSAEKALQDACAIEPENGDSLAHLAWAIWCNPRYASSRATREKARQMLNRALTLERTAPAFAFKGAILFESGQENLAESEFNKALKLDPRNLMARKGLKRIQEKREGEKKGLFGRMFR